MHKENDRQHDKTNEKYVNIADLIHRYETTGLNKKQELKLFSHLVKTGMAWTLQGFYGRTAKAVIEQGYINQDGSINWDLIGE